MVRHIVNKINGVFPMAAVEGRRGMQERERKEAWQERAPQGPWFLSSPRPPAPMEPPMAEQGWQPIDTAPKDGTPVELQFRAGFANVRGGSDPRRIAMPHRVRFSKWWTAEDAYRSVGRRSKEGARGALIAKNGGYWGSAGRKSRPLAGNPTHWRPLPAPPAGGDDGKREERAHAE